MHTRRFGEVSVLHLEPETYAKLLHLAKAGPGRPGGARYDADDPWHALIVEPHGYGCWVHTDIFGLDEHHVLPNSLLAILHEPMLGPCHLRVLTVRGFPASTWPGLLDDLNRLGFPYRWATRFLFLDKADGEKELARLRRQWFAKRKGIVTLLRETIFQQESPLVDSDAANKAVDADEALQALGSDEVAFGYVTATLVVWHEDARIAAERLKAAERIIQGRGFVTVPETLNAVEAWLSSIPGHAYANVRQPIVSTLNLAHLMPLSAVWAGPQRNEHLDGPPLLITRTEGTTPFRLTTYVGDVGHVLVVGPTGAGKSVLLATLTLQFRKYEGAQIYVFDKGRSVRAAMLGLVLSIGIVVDDAIVVVENVERHIELGERPKEAARRAMAEVTGPIIAITSVLAAVFIPTAFLSGLQGEFYRQFALTIAISTIISGINSLTLSPALAAVLLKGHGARKDALQRGIDAGLGWFFRPFNRFFERASERYTTGVRRVVRISGIVGVLYVGLIGLTYLGFAKLPTGFVPAQDKYYLVGIVQLPNAASLDRTTQVVEQVTRIALEEPGVESVVAFPGVSINGFVNVPNAAVMFAMLDPFEERDSPELAADAIAARLQGKVAQIPDGFIGLFPPPPVPGLGATGGFKMQIEDRGGAGYEALAAASAKVMQAAGQDPAITGLLTSFNVASPEVAVDVNRTKAKAQGVPLTGVFETMQTYLGSLYVNDFNRFGRTYQVFVQADAQDRSQLDAIGRLQVRNADGAMVPLSTLVDTRPSAGPDRVIRYNGYPSADISGGPAPGFSSGQAVAAMERIAAAELPAGMTYEWTELTYQEKAAGNAALYIFPLAVLMAFLILAALYNSWALPLAVILIVPMCLLSALVGVWLSDGDINIFTQIGFVVLVGLAAKNAILIVEFAKDAEEGRGLDPLQAALEACRLRLRPILMTSIAFTAGVIPLVLAHGAGAEMRQAMGIAVFAGMLGVTLFGLFLTPVFYVVIRRLVLRRASKVRPQRSTPAQEATT